MAACASYASRLVEVLKQQDEIVVTRDGVNDAPTMTFFEFVRSLLKNTPLSGMQSLDMVVGSGTASGWMEIIILLLCRSGFDGLSQMC